ncbi:TusA-related sulfurtransferase [Cricetibacter osteomyelitidis]|uniref:TusA-related sulfurtransferase n=1 Tax=Cricetibacter osteomyelitidis TaxID=1521931 RepID=A0A4R2T5Y8_9PAST|nr:sulfurtransferase TusA family protein [Cricetibacter osteomyelitidis]TCP96826.1 TusA-related sulfurtransferase [Cricetibacter osteomyelitidis]
MQYQLNVTKYRCPIPVLTVKKALKTLNVNDELRVLINNESTVEDFKLLCETNHCTILLEATIETNHPAQKTLIIRKVNQ